jgi:AcrR family transcriptional regulator
MTRRHLLDAAAIVFARNGFHGSTLDEVAATAGFTKGAVYSNFKSKEELFLALFDDRIEQQFAVITEVLESGPHEAAEQQPRIREFFHSDMFWDDAFLTLWLEFVLYARRNPAARTKLAEIVERSRAQVQSIIDHEYEVIRGEPAYPTRELAEISLALINGLALDRLLDPASVTDQTLDTTLEFLYAAMGVDGPHADR